MRIRRLIVFAIVVALAVVGLVLVFQLNDGNAGSPDTGAGLRINEVMTSNNGAVPDESGKFSDWIELFNPTDSALNISGYGLTDDKLAIAKWVFPQGTIIQPNGFIVVYCSGNALDGPLHASFRLSANDALVLTNTSGHAIDSLALRTVSKNCTLGRDETGTWKEFSSPSPGFPNTEEGAAAYQGSLQQHMVDNGVRINEFMASNATTLPGPQGDYPDWIELYNTTDAEVNLSGCGLSDKINHPMKWVFPEGTVIPAKNVLLIYCSGQDGLIEGELHVPFSLRAYKEDVVFAGTNGVIIDSYSFSNQEADISMARVPDGVGEWASCTQPTPGQLNNEAGYAAFTAAHSLPHGDLMLSELSINNVSALTVGGISPDWIELYNRSSSPINLGGYALTDNPKNPAKWTFPDTSIGPGEYMVVLATGNNIRDTQKKNLETNFGLNKFGEVVLLFSPEGELLDKLHVKNAGADVSYGRTGTALRYYKTPTPGAANDTGYAGITAQPVFSTTPGIYASPFELTITGENGARIYYTTDCTLPTAGSTQYTGPIPLNSNTVIRAVAIQEEYLEGATITGTFLFAADQVNHALPVATLVLEPNSLWDGKTGIYAFGDKYDPDFDDPDIGTSLLTANFYQGRGYQGEEIQTAWERDASFAIFDETTKQQVFSQDVSARIAGAYGRSRAQKGFTVIARASYGNNRLQYPFFENRPYTEYKSLTLRAGAQDQNFSKIRDELAAGLLEGTNVRFLYQAYKPYVLYLNGEYWGVYFLKEKRSRFFVAAHEGVEDAENLDLLKASSLISHGSRTEWQELMNYVKANDLSRQEHFKYVEERMDVQSFMDYMICEIYTGNTDHGNIQYYKLPGGKFKWIYYDFCWGFQNASHNTLAYRRGSVPAASDLFNAMLKNDGWREQFVRRFAELLDTAFAPMRVNALIDELCAIVEPEIKREREKFNSATFMGMKQRNEVLGDYDKFTREIQKIRTFANDRPASIKAQLKQEFNLSDSFMREVFP